VLSRAIRLGGAFAVLAAGVALLPAVHRAAAAPVLPAGFQVETIPAGQAAGDLTGFAMVPGGLPGAGGAYTIGKAGKVVWVSADGTVARTIAQLPVWAHQDIGLIGISVTKHYGETGKLLVMYTDNPAGPSHYAHAAVMTVDNPADPTSLTETQALLSDAGPTTQVEENSLSHGPGTILEGPDGYIYIGFGDESRYQDADPAAYRAQQLTDPHGKILRVDWSGHGVPANPYFQASAPDSWQSKVFVRGLRNPFRFGFDGRTGRLYVGDVGWANWEEINVARGGENFGWPCYEGMGRTNGHQNLPNCQAMYAANTPVSTPLYTWAHTPGGNAAVGGVFYTGTSYPAAYRGRYFFGDYVTGFINTLATDTKDQLTVPPVRFASGLGAPVAFDTAPNGDVVFADIASGNLKRLRYSAGNRPPTAVAEATNDPDTLTVHVDASASYDLDGDRLAFSTTFGDGSAAVPGPVTSHRYQAAGTYQVTVRVTDVSGAVGQKTLTVVPQNHTPTLNVVAPDAAQTYAVGDPVQLSATAADAEDGSLPVSWAVVLKHCPFSGPCHDHPDQTVTGNTFSEPFTDHGGDTYMQVTAKVVDSSGAVSQQVFDARPELQTISVSSGVPVTINGFNTSSLQVVAGQPVTVAAPAQQQEWTFTGWSDGGAATHSFTAPSSDVTLTANYTNAIDARYAALGGPAAVLGVATGPTVDLGGALAGGRYRPYTRGVIMWSARTGAHEVRGGILTRYWPLRDSYGFPTSDEVAAGPGRASYFERGNEYWSAATGTWFVRGGNLVTYLAIGGPAYGLPQMDERRTPDGRGSYQHFYPGNRSIYYYPTTGSHEVHGGIRAKWAALGWERGRLGYPTTNEFAIPGGRRSTFQHGYITYDARTGAVLAHYFA
jgi:glucose/arabinose dehydrogenase